MVDNLLSCTKQEVVTDFIVRDDCIFVTDNCLSVPGMVENIAQTCAAGIGYENLNNSETIKLGFIGSIRNFESKRLPKCGETLTTCTKVIEEVFSMTLVNAEIKVGDELIATAEMKIALSDIDSQKQ